MKDSKKVKRLVRRRVTFQSQDDRIIWLEGQLAIGNLELRRSTGLTNGQIAYRFKVLKETLGLKESVRGRWRNGNHPILKRILKDYHAVLMADLDTKVIPQLTLPSPETVRIKEDA